MAAAGLPLVAALLGIALAQAFPMTPAAALAVAAPAVLLALPRTRLRPGAVGLACLALGAAWSAWRAPPPTDWFARVGKTPVTVVGVVDGLPETHPHGVRFPLRVRSVLAPADQPFPERVRVDWYGRPPDLAVGEVYRLTLRLRPAVGRRNPGRPDPADVLHRRGLEARAYVLARAGFSALGREPGGLHGLRQALAEAIAAHLSGRSETGVIQALALGVRSGIDDGQWRVLLATGTNHLVAISGLHVGLVAGLAFWVGRRLWAGSGAGEYLPAPRAGALLALLAATAYAALAGFSVPTQRALIMLAVALAAPLAGRHPPPGRILLLAALAVALWDPTATLAAGAWLSFAAVAVLVYTHHGRVLHGASGRWWRAARPQWVLGLGLLPLVGGLFGQVSWVAPLVNMVAVPWTGLLVVPLTLAGAAAQICGMETVAGWALQGAAQAWGGLWWVLERAAAGVVVLPAAPLWAWPTALVGTLWLLAPRGVPARWLGALWLAPVLFSAPPRPTPDTFWLTLWDSGDGLAAVVETARHLLVYDTGTPATGVALARWLQSRGWRDVDVLVLSRDGARHAGGAVALAHTLPARRVAVGEAGAWAGTATSCAGAWAWDGVRLRLHRATGKDGGCVLSVQGPGGSLLLTGDWRRGRLEPPLPARMDVLQVPDHGSHKGRDLSGLGARLALASVAPGNRWGYPRSEVVARYRAAGAHWLDTAVHGALAVRFDPATGLRVQARCGFAPGFCALPGGWLE